LEKRIAATFSMVVGTMCLGNWGANFNTKQIIRFVDQYVDIGVRDFD